MSKELIRLRNIRMAFDDEVVLNDLNLYINDKEFLTLLGPSGCGKTTTLRIIGGFTTPVSGDVLFDGVRINDVPPYRRQINTVFQKYALFPHLNVYENIAFGLRMQKLPEAEIKERVMEMLETVSLKGFEHRRPEALSGGQQQRVAIARALVNRPKVLLLDEPLAALDLKLRKDMQIELKRIQQQVGITFIYVTHDQVEAMAMADMIVLINKGKIMQKGNPRELYNDPDNTFTAQFMGTPPMNVFSCDGKIQMGFRPERAELSRTENGKAVYRRKARIITCEMLGSETVYKVETGDGIMMVKSRECEFEAGEECHLSVPDEFVLFFDGEGQRIRLETGENREAYLRRIRGEYHG